MKYLLEIVLVFWFTITLTGSSLALRINEFESNPVGSDSGAEWIELYSENSVNIEGYILQNGDGQIFNLSGSFSGYFVVTFPILWLDNSNETIYLKLNEDIIDSAGPFNDAKNNDKAYSLCGDAWNFVESTKNEDNSCSSETPQTSNNTNNHANQNKGEEQEIERKIENKTNKITENKTNNELLKISENMKKPQRIILSYEQDESDGETTKTYKTRRGVIYFFIAFSTFLVIMIALRKL